MKICTNCNEIIDLDKIKYCPYCTSDKLKSFRLSEYLKPDKISILFEYRATGKTYQDYLAIKDHPNYFDVGNRQKKYVGLWFDDNDDLFHKIPTLHTEYVKL